MQLLAKSYCFLRGPVANVSEAFYRSTTQGFGLVQDGVTKDLQFSRKFKCPFHYLLLITVKLTITNTLESLLALKYI